MTWNHLGESANSGQWRPGLKGHLSIFENDKILLESGLGRIDLVIMKTFSVPGPFHSLKSCEIQTLL